MQKGKIDGAATDMSVLIVHGTRGSIVKPDDSRQVQQAYPNAQLHLIEGGAHGFSKKHDAIAIAYLRRFVGGNKV